MEAYGAVEVVDNPERLAWVQTLQALRQSWVEDDPRFGRLYLFGSRLLIEVIFDMTDGPMSDRVVLSHLAQDRRWKRSPS